jgi:opacity protein-like surface antigen
LSIINNNDVHHLRSDLQQDPSISMTGYGIGVDGDAGVKFMLIKNMFLNAGYRVYWNHAIDGTVKFHNAGAPSDSFPLTQFQSLRQGWTFGLNYTF